MKLGMIGVGQAGGKIVDEFVRYEKQTSAGIVRAAMAVNTARTDLEGLDNIPEDNRILIGQSRVKGHGVGADNELASSIFEQDIGEVQRALDQVAAHQVDAFLIVAGLGGGTGSGGAPVVAKYLKRIYTEPVYGLGILPGSDEGGIYTLNAARSFKTFVDEVDNLLVFDNDSWRQSGESVAEGYTSLNRELVSQFGLLFRAGEIEAGGNVAESVVDSSEIINTLASGGVTTLGYAESQLQESEGGGDGLLSSFSQSEPEVDTTESINRVTSLVRQATLGRLTLPCEVGSTQRALVVTGGPPAHLSRKGIERSRKWLEEETDTMEVRGGDYPYPDSGVVSVAVVLSGVTNIPRVKELQQVAVEAQDNIEEIKQEQELEDDLMDNEELDSLF